MENEMISDTLFEAVGGIDKLLRDLPEVYQGELRQRIIKMRDEMNALRIALDTPPNHS
jgi:hypothetical protein